MKTIASGLLVLGLLAVQVPEANAAACAAGPYRAGCVGPRGAVGVHRGYGLPRRSCRAVAIWRALLLSVRPSHLHLTRLTSAKSAPAIGG
jgi:hypothetical protein